MLWGHIKNDKYEKLKKGRFYSFFFLMENFWQCVSEDRSNQTVIQ